MGTYSVIAQRDGKFWHLYVPDIDYGTQARCLGEVDVMVKDLISTVTDEPIADIEVSVEFADSADAERYAEISRSTGI